MGINPVDRVLKKNNSFDPNGMELIFFSGWHGLIRIDSVDSVLTRNGLKLIFYPSRNGLTCIDPVDSVLIENDGFDLKWPENSYFTLVDMVWHVLTQWNRFSWKDAVDSRKIYFWILNFFLIFLDFYK